VTEITLERIAGVTRNILAAGKTPITIGGEHTITLGVMKGLGEISSKTAIVSFDAHLDLRDSFLDSRLSHTTFMRRINEEINPPKIIEIGTRAVCKEELVYAKEAAIDFFPAHKIKNNDIDKIINQIKKQLTKYESIYLSIDMDILDPSYAPAVQNPEPDGLDPYTLLQFLFHLCNKKVIGFDIVEVAPNYDLGISSIQAAKIMFEVLCFLEKNR
jgi:agmatinase